MIAGIYARKSTDDSDRHEDARSTTRQVERARAYAGLKGWTVDDAYIYVDDNISGAEWVGRHAFNRMLAALGGDRPPFGVLVVMEMSRIGRDTVRVPYFVQVIEESGVEIWGYSRDRRIGVEDEDHEVETMLESLTMSRERRRISQRTKDGLRFRVQKGGVGGGRLYGYANVSDEKLVRRVVNPDEAAVLNRIYGMYVAGRGFFGIAKTLNAERVRAPRGAGWSQGGIAAMLRNEHYVGKVVYGRRERFMRRGTKGTRARDPKSWITVEDERLRIIPRALWDKAQKEREARGGPSGARRPRGRDSNGKYALTGFAVCAKCGGPVRITVRASGHAPHRTNVPVYVCGTFESRGTCANNVAVKAPQLERAVVEGISRYLDADVLGPAVDRALARIVEQRGPDAGRRAHLVREAERLDQKSVRLAAAIGETDAMAPLVAELRNVEKRRASILSEIEALADTAAPLDAGAVKAALASYVTDVKALLAGSSEQARNVLKQLLRGRITMEPYKVGKDKGYKFSGEMLINRLFGGTSLSVHSCT